MKRYTIKNNTIEVNFTNYGKYGIYALGIHFNYSNERKFNKIQFSIVLSLFTYIFYFNIFNWKDENF